MPIFTTKPKEVKEKKKKSAAGIAQEILDKYKPFIEELGKNLIGRLELEKDDESPMTVRKALVAAGEKAKKYVKVRKPRGEQNVLEIELVTRKEYLAAKQAAKEKAEKIAQAKAAPKPKAKTKAKAKAKKKS